MLATNHMTTGTLIAAAELQPELAIQLAFASCLVIDALPLQAPA
jgi:hypothetical protein